MSRWNVDVNNGRASLCRPTFFFPKPLSLSSPRRLPRRCRVVASTRLQFPLSHLSAARSFICCSCFATQLRCLHLLHSPLLPSPAASSLLASPLAPLRSSPSAPLTPPLALSQPPCRLTPCPAASPRRSHPCRFNQLPRPHPPPRLRLRQPRPPPPAAAPRPDSMAAAGMDIRSRRRRPRIRHTVA